MAQSKKVRDDDGLMKANTISVFKERLEDVFKKNSPVRGFDRLVEIFSGFTSKKCEAIRTDSEDKSMILFKIGTDFPVSLELESQITIEEKITPITLNISVIMDPKKFSSEQITKLKSVISSLKTGVELNARTNFYSVFAPIQAHKVKDTIPFKKMDPVIKANIKYNV